MDKAKAALQKFLQGWKDKNPLKQYKYCQTTWKANHSKGHLENMFKGLPLADFEIKDIDVQRVNTVDFNVILTADINGKLVKKKAKARILCEKAAYKPSPEGTWGVNPISILKLEDVKE